MTPVPTLLRAEDAAAHKVILDGLAVFNDAASGAAQEGGPLSAVLRDGADGPVLGGVIGHVYGSWLHLDLFHLPEPLRGAGHGTRLVGMLEDAARAMGAVGAYVETFSFQARGFYERLGYVPYAEIEGFPPGHLRHALLKRFDAADRHGPGAAPSIAKPITGNPGDARPAGTRADAPMSDEAGPGAPGPGSTRSDPLDTRPPTARPPTGDA